MTFGRGLTNNAKMAAPSHTRKKRSALRLLVAGEAAGLLASMRRSGRWAGNKMVGHSMIVE